MDEGALGVALREGEGEFVGVAPALGVGVGVAVGVCCGHVSSRILFDPESAITMEPFPSTATARGFHNTAKGKAPSTAPVTAPPTPIRVLTTAEPHGPTASVTARTMEFPMSTTMRREPKVSMAKPVGELNTAPVPMPSA